MNFKYCPNCGKESSVDNSNPSAYKCTACNWQFWNNPKTSVTTVFVRGDEVLIGTKVDKQFEGQLVLTGGFVDYNESPYDAARREAMEETGVKLVKFDLLDVWHREYDSDNMPPISVVDCVFVITEWEGEHVPSDDVATLEWCPLSYIEDPSHAFTYPGLLKKLNNYLDNQNK